MILEIVLAAGCFWGVQAVFDNTAGVVSTQVGYTGGITENPTYKDVSSGLTHHAEAVKVVYDDSKISTKEILDVFFQSHNPTTLNRQGPDIGTQYRSAIFYSTPQQKEIAQEKIKQYQPFFKSKIVTEVVPLKEFYPAEEYHQKYLQKTGRACHINDNAFDKEAYYKSTMSKERYNVMRLKETEKPYSGKYLVLEEDGIYRCGACGQALFSASSRFDSGSGWPSFDKALPNAVEIRKDYSHFMIRDEVVCSRCKSHLGHIFKDGPTPTGNRFCINSVALDFIKEKPAK